MNIEDKMCRARGFVDPFLVDISTGKMMPISQRHNTLSYASADAMAAAFGGDPSFIPSKIGFVYGTSDKAVSGTSNTDSGSSSGSSAVANTESSISRVQNWELFKDFLETNTLDVQIVNFSYSPTLKPTKADYSHNAVTFHAVSNSQTGGIVTENVVFGTESKLLQAVLLGYNGGNYTILSRVSLNYNDGYLTKPAGFEVALDWTIEFE